MWGTLLFISDKHYNPEKEEDFDAICKRLEKFFCETEIPETYYCDLTDEAVIDKYVHGLPSRDEEYIQILKNCLAKATTDLEIEYYNKRLAYELGPDPTIEEYYNSLDEYAVHDGKLYTTRNYIDGIIDFIALREFANRISKTGTTPNMLQQKDFSMVDRNFAEVTLVVLDEGLVHYERGLLFSDEEDKKYDQTIREVIASLNPNTYIYSFAYHF